jgi:hypothetical protein
MAPPLGAALLAGAALLTGAACRPPPCTRARISSLLGWAGAALAPHLPQKPALSAILAPQFLQIISFAYPFYSLNGNNFEKNRLQKDYNASVSA